ncbi:MAG: RdgB/HAM1 family non-canonical purine NTP pyrophosphatase [Daejeonella sp.]
MMELVFASNNRHKVDEVQSIAGDKFLIRSLDEIGCYDEIPETGNTFEANAGQKSRFIYERYNLACFADDSGLEIDALNGEPGVDSAHYSGSRDFGNNIALVLEKLGNNSERRARFRTVISLIIDGTEHLFEGSIEGRITETISGTRSFGYDPIFIPSGYDITFAEMDAAEKNRISHRAIAVHKMIGFLRTL